MKGRGARRKQGLIALCALAFALFNFPLLIVWDQPATVFGLPLLPVALFTIWALLIGLLAWISEGGRRGKPPGRDDRP